MTNISAPGQIAASSPLSGSEVVSVNDGPVWVGVTTQQIADLAGSVVQTLTTTNPSTTRAVYGKVALTYAGNVTIASGSGYVAGTRGEINVAAGTTAKDGFYYGSQGKIIVAGTINQTSATRVAGVIGQLDLSAATVTAGQVSAGWFDMGATGPSGGFDAETNVVRATNTTSQSVNAILYGYGKASYGMDLSDNSSSWLSTTGTAGTTAAKGWIKVNINGSTRYIPLTDSVS